MTHVFAAGSEGMLSSALRPNGEEGLANAFNVGGFFFLLAVRTFTLWARWI